ncbi:MAG: PadR family transcriptional regulator [Candidatus Hydrogenedentes bacterium]|jgi:PadR family transcriptional regulator PadR|nr:PadR family transcriptional regulator [Candidatus Hydrogenedentota bacterium]
MARVEIDSGEMDLGNWTTQLRKGLLELCIVNLLAQGELYGYDLVKRVTAIRGVVVTEGTIYPLLSRLRKAGLLETRSEESPNGPARKYYRLTPAGEQTRQLMNACWRDIEIGVDGLINEGNGR